MPAVLKTPFATALTPASSPVVPLLREVPRLLEYRSEADPDAEFIPKTVGGFCFGAMLSGFCVNFGEQLFTGAGVSETDLVKTMMVRFAFMLGITMVAASLLLVGRKVRADHSTRPLFARHWLNSIGTGGVYALLVWGPWFMIEHGWGLAISRFVAAGIWMSVMAFPAIAARWTIAPHHSFGEAPGASV